MIYDNGSEFKLHFEDLCDIYGFECKPTTVKNPQANAILKCMHSVFADMLRTTKLDLSEWVKKDAIDIFITKAASTNSFNP